MYTTRNDFGKLFQEYFQTGIGAEIGVQNGFNAVRIGADWKGIIICVDNWINEEVERIASDQLKDNKFVMLKHDSADAAKIFKDETLDWVYIDAGHSYAEVKADFEGWFPKVRKGGIVSGHDYGVNDCMGVKEFIDEYLQLHTEVTINFTTDDFWEGREYQSWWFVKE